jgi:hypothetical protein
MQLIGMWLYPAMGHCMDTYMGAVASPLVLECRVGGRHGVQLLDGV